MEKGKYIMEIYTPVIQLNLVIYFLTYIHNKIMTLLKTQISLHYLSS